jgi:hypothetical protein
MWAKNWLLGRDRFTHSNLLNFIRNDRPEDYRNYFRMSGVLAKVNPLIEKQDTAMRNAITPEVHISATLRSLATGRSFEDLKFAVWIRETGSGPPTHVRANSEPSPARGAPHTDEFDSLEPEPSRAGLASQTLTCMGTFKRFPCQGTRQGIRCHLHISE